MCRRVAHRPWERSGRALFPKSTPPGLNYAVLTGTLIGDPAEGGGPGDDPVTLLKIEFPVAHPEHPRLLWAYAVYDIEVPGDVGGREVKELRKGAPVLVAGRLSERLVLKDGQASRHGSIVATLVKPGPHPEQSDSLR